MLDLGARQGTRWCHHRQEARNRRMLLLGFCEAGCDVLNVTTDLVLTHVRNRPIDDGSIAQPFA
jgi:hypothetical protein